MAKPSDPGSAAPGQQQMFVATHPTDPSSPKTVTNEQWRTDNMEAAGWTKEGKVDPNAPHVEHH